MSKATHEPSKDGSDPTDRERLEWLLEFLRRDVSSMRPGELADTLDDSIAFCLSSSVAGILTHEQDRELELIFLDRYEGDPRGTVDVLSARLSELQAAITEGVRLLNDAEGWVPFQENAPLWRLSVRKDRTVVRTYLARLDSSFVAAAAEILQDWWPQLRQCQYDDCGTWFLPRHGRQEYHDPRCSARKRQANFTPKRDYHEEYRKRVQRHSPGAKPQRRPRKRKEERK